MHAVLAIAAISRLTSAGISVEKVSIDATPISEEQTLRMLEEVDEEGCSDHRRNRSYRQLCRREYNSGDDVAEDQEDATGEEGCGKQEPVIGTEHQPADMRYEEADEPDNAADRDGKSRNQRRQQI
jgi:hypothetical protein